MIRILLMVFLALIALSSTLLAADGVVDYSENQIRHAGEDRLYLVYLPPQYNKKLKLPVVLAMHGGGGSAAQFLEQTRMDKTADRHGFIVVYPEGIGSRVGDFHTWNVERCCGRAAKENIDDVGFIVAVIDDLQKKYNIDTKRVYATGHSNGGMMSYRLACKVPNKIAAIAPNAGGMDMLDCVRSRAVPILHIHGTEDKCANYNGGEECGGCFADMVGIFSKFTDDENRGACEPVPVFVDKWAQRNGCGEEQSVVFQKGAVSCAAYNQCNAPVTLCSIRGAGHTWPGGQYSTKICANNPDGRRCRKLKGIVGAVNHDIDANEFMWSFFSQHKLP